MLVKLFLFFLWIFCVPLFTGYFGASYRNPDQRSLFPAYFYGIFIEFALFEILAVPMIFLKCSLGLLTGLWAVLTLSLAIFSLYKSIRPLPVKKIHPLICLKNAFCRMCHRITPLLGVVLICILSEASFVTLSQHIDDDDAFYVATSVTSVETDTLMEYDPYTGEPYESLPARYVLSAWPIFLAVLSSLTGFHPAIIAHFLLPGLILIFAYMIYALIARELFPYNNTAAMTGNKKAESHKDSSWPTADARLKQDLFLLFVILILSFSGFSRYSSATFLLIRNWQGKALAAGVMQPALFYICRCTMKNHGGRISWFILFCTVTSSCMFSSMGVVLSIIPSGVYALIYGIEQKQWRYLPYTLIACSGALICGIVYSILR